MIVLPNDSSKSRAKKTRAAAKAAALDPDNWNEFVAELSDIEALELYYDWPTFARPNQLIPPGDHWTYWLILAGRGWGKTRCGAEFVRYHVENKLAGRIALIAEDAGLGVLPKPRQVLPVETPRVLEWSDAGSVVIFTRVLFFEVDAPRIVVAREADPR